MTAALRTYEDINARIEGGDVVVVTADELSVMVAEEGLHAAAQEVDAVTTGTFSPMCSSGVILNFGHSDPPIRMQDISLNGVPAYGGLAAVDTYLGATSVSKARPEYGGAHVIEALLRGEQVRLDASSSGTDCYPLHDIKTHVSLASMNEAVLFNPRNAYQNYSAAVNTSSRTIRTYMGTLLPRMGNMTYATSGQLSPLLKDPSFRSVGLGTRIFLGGAQGYVVWHGTQHAPAVREVEGKPIVGGGTLATMGALREMSPDFLRAAFFPGYGVTLFVGLGLPIPILDEAMAAAAAVPDTGLYTQIVDYSVPHRDRPSLGVVSYAELRSGSVSVGGCEVPTSSLSSYAKAREIAERLRDDIAAGRFLLQKPVWTLPPTGGRRTLEMG